MLQPAIQVVQLMSRFSCVLAALAALLAVVPCWAVVYVDAAAAGSVHDGKSWGTAFRTIGQAVSSTAGGDIWIRAGTYAEAVTLRHTINLYGGFLGCETSLSQRLLGISPTVIDGKKTHRAIDVPAGAWVTIDGITVRRGYADIGAGVRCDTSSIVKIRNCRIENCKATQQAGGVYYGKYTQGEMTGTVIAGCEAPNGAGGVVEYHSYPTWSRDILIRNHASLSGGAVYCPFHSGALLQYCTLAYNTAGLNGGSVYAYYGGPVTLNHCIVACNTAPVGGGVFGDGGSSQATLTCCDFWANAVGDFGGYVTTPPVTNGNTYVDPLFLMPESDDFHLSPGSPCPTVGAFPLQSPLDVDKIGVAKELPDGTSVRLAAKVVASVDGETAYVQEPDRSAAIAARGLTGYQQGDLLSSVSGTLATEAGCRTLQSATATLHARGVYAPKPLAVRLDQLHLSPCVLIRTWGRTTDAAAAAFTIEYAGARVPVRYSGTSVQPGAMVAVTGVYTLRNDIAASAVTQY